MEVWFRGLDPRRTVVVSEGLPVRDARVSRDLVVPGACVHGSLRDPPPTPPDGSPPELRIHWKPKGEGPHAEQATEPLPDGTWRIDGVTPGTYVVRGCGHDLVGDDGRPVEFEVRADDTTVRVDLEVRVPERR